jgi:hypothetical protein
MDIPAELKFISPFIQRGQELTTRDPVTSYYGKKKTKQTRNHIHTQL